MKRIWKFMKKTGTRDALWAMEGEIQIRLQKAFRDYREVRKKAPQERQGFLESLAEAKAHKNGSTKEVELKK